MQKDKGNRKEELKKLLLKGKQVVVFSKLENLSTKVLKSLKLPSSRIMKLQSQRTL